MKSFQDCMSVRLFAGLLLCANAVAAEPGHPCSAVVEPQARLSCYDAAFPPTTGSSGVIDLEQVREQAVRDFGLSVEQKRERTAPEIREILPDRIEATVADVTHRDTGQRVVTLDNGQVWLLTESGSKGHVKIGDRVVVRAAAMGTHMLVTAARVPLRARRTR